MASKSSIRTKVYSSFRGVDFSTDPSLVDSSRSPWAPNMISDMGGMPEKRTGWRILTHGAGERVNGMYTAEFSGKRRVLCHIGTKLYNWDNAQLVLAYEGALPDERSTAVYMGGFLWIFTGVALLKYDGTSVVPASVGAYVPLTQISVSPVDGFGTRYEDVNYLTPLQRISYLADGETTEYKLPYEGVNSVESVTVDGTVLNRSEYTTDLANGKVTFKSAPKAPDVGAENTVFITFSRTVEGYSDKINKCRIATVWGVGGSFDRIIASGNPDFPNYDFTSGFSDGTYWPDLGYQIAGTSQTAILGYRRLGEYLAIIKEDNGQDSTVFIRSGALSETGEAIWSMKPCLSGAGAVTRFGFGNIDDEQLYLTGAGVYALTTNSLTSEKIVQNRSGRVDPKLTKENLSDAVCITFDNSFMVFVNGNVYVLDGKRQKSYATRADTAFLYECYFWNSIPARVVMKITENGREELYFGTDNGDICRFNTDIDDLHRFNDNGDPINAVWSTKADDDGDPMILKTLIKKGNAVTLKPFYRSSAVISFRTDKDAVAWEGASGTVDIFNWEDIDFERFTFDSNDGPSEIPLNRKIKNYKRLQIVVSNNEVNEGFGVYGIVKHFVTGNFAKK